MSVSITWTWTCLGTGRESCPASGNGTTGLNKHLESTRHGVVMRGIPAVRHA